MKTRHSYPRSAFTLIEIMVALSLMAVIIAAIYSAWYAIIKGSTAAANAAATAQRTRLTMRMMEDSLLGSCMYTQNASYYQFLVDSEGDFTSLSFVSRLPKSFLRGRKFDGADIRRVNFTVEDGPRGEKQLVLRQSLLLMDMDQDEKENPLVVADNVKLFVVEFIDPKTKDWTGDWPYTNQIPSEIRIQLQLGNQDLSSDKPMDTLVGVVAPLAQAVLPQWQAPLGLPATVPANATNQPNQPNQLNPGGQQPGFQPGTQPGFQSGQPSLFPTR